MATPSGKEYPSPTAGTPRRTKVNTPISSDSSLPTAIVAFPKLLVKHPAMMVPTRQKRRRYLSTLDGSPVEADLEISSRFLTNGSLPTSNRVLPPPKLRSDEESAAGTSWSRKRKI